MSFLSGGARMVQRIRKDSASVFIAEALMVTALLCILLGALAAFAEDTVPHPMGTAAMLNQQNAMRHRQQFMGCTGQCARYTSRYDSPYAIHKRNATRVTSGRTSRPISGFAR